MLSSSRASASTAGPGATQSPRERRRTSRHLIVAICAAGALGAAVSPAAPTGLAAADAVWCGAVGALTAYAGSRARRWAWLWFTGVVAVGSIGSWWATAAVVALALAVFGAFLPVRERALGAVIGALAVQSMLRMPSQGSFGLPTLLALVAIAPLLWSAYDRSPRQVRRNARLATVVLVVATVLIGLGAGLAVLLSRSDLQQGIDEAESGLDLISSGDQSRGADRLYLASDRFGAAERSLTAPWTWPARLVPVLAQHRDAMATAATTGHDVADRAATAAGTAPYQSLKASKGTVDLAAVTSFQAPVAVATSELQHASDELRAADSPWLLPVVGDRMDTFQRKVDEALPEAETAREALAIAPAMLGADQGRTYLVLFTNPAETRFLGGFTGSYGLLTAKDGRVDFKVSGRINELLPLETRFTRTLDASAEYEQRYGRFNTAANLQNLTASPDLPTDAQVARALYQQVTGVALDGVVVVDPYGLASLLKLTGPVLVEGLDQPLTAQNAAKYLVSDQYLAYAGDPDQSDRKDRLEAAGRAVFDALTSRDLPGPRAIGEALGPAVAQKRLLFYPFVPGSTPLFGRLETLGAFTPDASGDYVSLRTANANPNKIDTALFRTVSYTATYDPDSGAVDATATITLKNTSATTGPAYVVGNDRDEPPGTNTLYLSFYSPLDIVKATLGGKATGVESQRELGSRVYSSLVTVPPGASVKLVLTLRGAIPAGTDYHLEVLNQPTVQPDTLSIKVQSAGDEWRVASADGLEVSSGAAATRELVTTDQRYTVTFTR